MASRRSGINPRAVQVALGALLGFAWGTIMWLIMGQDGGARLWIYIAMTTAMLGCGVAAFFGAASARKRNERISPGGRRRKDP